MEPSRDAPAVVRRRRKIARQQREQTPEAAKFNKLKVSDEDSSSFGEPQNSLHPKAPPEPPIRTVEPLQHPQKNISAHLSKILGRRDKKISGSTVRSLSSPREEKQEENSEVHHLMKQARRSLSSPRQKEDNTSDSTRSPSPARNSSTIRQPRLPTRSNTNANDLSQFEKNIMRFENERRRFLQEKKLFEKEKHEMDIMRKKRAEEFDKKNLISGHSPYGRRGDRKRIPAPHDESEKLELIKNFHAAQKLSIRDENSDRNSLERKSHLSSRPSDYESSTAASCTETEDEADKEFKGVIDAVSKDAPKAKQEILDKWVMETQSMTFDDEGKPKIIVNDAEEIVSEPNGATIEPIVEDTKVPLGKLLTTIRCEARIQWNKLKAERASEITKMRLLRNKCLGNLVILIIFCGFGGMFFRFVEGSFENMYKCGVKKVKRDFIDHLWLSSHNMREDDWKSLARTRLRKFEEELQVALEAGIKSYSGIQSWNFINGVLYCLTVVTTIGYGHISPTTTLGQTMTIVYAIFGIPLFLILLADFGKLFTRSIKFIWAFVRRVYYTGSCRKVRKTAQVKKMMSGINMVYEVATFRRPSMMMGTAEPLEKSSPPGAPVISGPIISSPVMPSSNATHSGSLPRNILPQAPLAQMPPLTPMSHTSLRGPQSTLDSPTTPQLEEVEIDDEFNLPISLAFIILVLYILIGASVYTLWEEWTFFESFYFVFISMSTIGFGDYVPKHPIFMMTTIVYLVFGLALTSMCINVVQVKLSDHFRQASAKIVATIGLSMAEEEAARQSQLQTPNELMSVHSMSPVQVEQQNKFDFPQGNTNNVNNNNGSGPAEHKS